MQVVWVKEPQRERKTETETEEKVTTVALLLTEIDCTLTSASTFKITKPSELSNMTVSNFKHGQIIFSFAVG